MSEFRRLGTCEQMFRYAETRLSLIGCGSSRCAFDYGSNLVLKVARPRPSGNVQSGAGEAIGTAANEAEVEVFTHPETKPVVAAIHDFDSKYRWLLVESVDAFSTDSQFKSITGYSLKDFIDTLIEYADGYLTRGEVLEMFDDDLADGVVGMIRNGLSPGDLKKPDHWGLAPDGRLVILDYGWNEEIHQYYDF